MKQSTEQLTPLQRAVLALEKMQARLDAATVRLEQIQHEPIAVIGMGCRFPGQSDHPAAFWQLLKDGRDTVDQAPLHRWGADLSGPAAPDDFIQAGMLDGGYLEAIDQFDPHFFGISPREASFLDPQQRLLLEVSWEALENAGYVPDRLVSDAVGVFVGITLNEYAAWLKRAGQTAGRPLDSGLSLITGNTLNAVAGRISYTFGFTGPSMAVDTACSSSLVALHLACQSLRQAECQVALVGGVNLIIDAETTSQLIHTGMLSPDGRCKTFDAAANGFVRGEGCGVVILKRLTAAQTAGDPILAVIRGSAVNQNGPSSNLTTPHGRAQQALIRTALKAAKLEPAQISYIEAHGTGTALGDPVEVAALGEIFAERQTSLLIGSVKTNVGHLEAASGIAGFIKVVLSLQHQTIPPHLHYHQPNPAIAWDQLPIRVPTAATPWLAEQKFAGVSSFGASGTNAHVILGEAPALHPNPPQEEGTVPPLTLVRDGRGEHAWHLLTLSAKNEQALCELAQRYSEHLANHPELALADVCYTANVGRSHFDYRLSATASSLAQLQTQLMAFARNERQPGVSWGHVARQFRDNLSNPVALPNDVTDWQALLESLGALYVQGATIDWGSLAGTRRKIELPTYPFQRQRYWVDALPSPFPGKGRGLRPLIDKLTKSPLLKETICETEFSLATLPLLADHQVADAVVSPAACHLAMILNGLELVGHKLGSQLDDVFFPTPLVIPTNGKRLVQLVFTPNAANGEPTLAFQLISLADDDAYTGADAYAGADTATASFLHATGQAKQVAGATPMPELLTTLRQRCADAVTVETLYQAAERQQIRLGPNFRWLDSLWRGNEEWLGKLRRPDAAGSLAGYVTDKRSDLIIHPGLLDACFQLAAFSQLDGAIQEPLLPFSLTTLRLYRAARGSEWWCHIRQRSAQQWDIRLLDALGQVIIEIVGFELRMATPTTMRRQESWQDWLYTVEWQACPLFGLRPDYLPAPQAIQQQTTKTHLYGDPSLEGTAAALIQLETLATDYVVAALTKLGFTFAVGTNGRSEELAYQLAVRPRYHRLFRRLLTMLTEDGLLERTGENWRVIKAPVIHAPSSPEEAQTSVIAAEWALLQRCGERLADVLCGRQEPLEILFPGGDTTLVTSLYQNSPVAQAMNRQVQQAVLAALTRLPIERGIRILEVGAGTGSTTAMLLPHLPAERTEYCFTDIGPAFLHQAQIKFRDYPFVRYQALDIEQPPIAQGFAPHQYDIIVAANVLHATQDLQQSLQHVQQLLAPGGLFVLLEATTRQRWVDLTFGLTEGWWRFTDSDRQTSGRTDHPLLSVDQWQALLTECGFSGVTVLPMPLDDHAAAPQAVLLAQAGATVIPQDRAWLLFTDAAPSTEAPTLTGMGEMLATELRKRGEQPILVRMGATYAQHDACTFTIDPTAPADYVRLLQATPQVAGVVHLWSLGMPRLTKSFDLDGAGHRSYGSVLYLAQALLQTRTAPHPQADASWARLWLVTQGAQAVRASDAVSGVSQAPLWGLGKVIALEHPELHTICFDLDPTGALAPQAAALCAQLLAPADEAREAQLALRQGRLHVARLRRFVSQPTGSALGIVTGQASATYLITGGLGGLGLLVAHWLVEQGARHLVLVGRSQPKAAIQRQLDQLAAIGVTVRIAQADVADFAQMTHVLQTIDPRYPLRGIVHAAGVLEDAALLHQSWTRFSKVLSPKILGAWHLHQLTKDQPLDFFVLFSSATSLFGRAGQANHAAANAFLDAFAHYRHSQHLPALSISWGAWSEVGAAAALGQREQQRLATGGQGFIPPEQGIQALAGLLEQDVAHVAVIPLDWTKFLKGLPAPTAFFADFTTQHLPAILSATVESPQARPEVRFLTQLQEINPAKRKARVNDYLVRQIAQILRYEPMLPLNPQSPLTALGMDSLMSIELKNWIGRELKINLPVVTLLDASIEELTTLLADELLRAELASLADSAGRATETSEETLEEFTV